MYSCKALDAHMQRNFEQTGGAAVSTLPPSASTVASNNLLPLLLQLSLVKGRRVLDTFPSAASLVFFVKI